MEQRNPLEITSQKLVDGPDKRRRCFECHNGHHKFCEKNLCECYCRDTVRVRKQEKKGEEQTTIAEVYGTVEIK